MENKDQPAFATSAIDGYNNYHQTGLTKLEYFSIHCLQGILTKDVNYTAKEKVFVAIGCAKELLKQLEDESTK